MRFRIYRLRFLLLILTCLLWLGFQPDLTWAAAPKQVLIIDLPRFVFEDLSPRYPNLIKLANESSVGILAPRISGPVNPEKLYLNLSSGQQLWSVEEARLILDSHELYNNLPADQLYQSLTGYRAHPNGAVYLGLPRIIQLNLKNQPKTNIGVIGKVLHSYGFKTAAIGNADTTKELNRAGSIPLVDQAGLIDLAAIGRETTRPDPAFPSGLRSDPDKIFDYWRQFSGKARLISISLGDLERIEHYRDYLTESRRQFFRNLALHNYDRLIGKIMADINPDQTMVVLYSIYAPEVEGQGQRLNPVLIKAANLRPGLILADSTRRVGLLTGSDLISAIFSYLGIKNQDVYTGQTIRSVSGNWPQVAKMLNQLDLNHQARWTILPVHGYALIIVVLAFIFGLIYWPDKQRLFATIQQIYLFLMTIPAVCLLVSLVDPVDWFAISGWIFGLTALVYLVVRLLTRHNETHAVAAIATLTIILIILDGLRNGWLELRSFWGYSAVSAARFYGVGNEYLGFLLGAYIVLITLCLNKINRYRTQLLWGGWLVLSVFLFYPAWGANVGGGISVVLGLGIANFIWLNQPITKKRIGLLVVALVGLLTLVGVVDLFISGRQMSHLGQFINLIAHQGYPALTELVSRKLQLNQTLIQANGLSYVLIGCLIAIPLLYKKSPRWVQKWKTKNPTVAKGLLNLAITSIIALFFNDSGIVTVATMFIFGVDLFLLTAVKEPQI